MQPFSESELTLRPLRLTDRCAFLRHFEDYVAHEPQLLGYLARGRDDFPAFVKSLQLAPHLTRSKFDDVPTSYFWLFDKQQRLLGSLNIRHALTTDYLINEAGHIGFEIAPRFRHQGLGHQILALGLEKAQQIGLTSVLLTCFADNLASKRVILSQNAQFEKVVQGEVHGQAIEHYALILDRLGLFAVK
ncbi:MAG: GNAT family N-acetyltransferase [Vibrio sp.]